MNASSELRLGNGEHLLGLRAKFPCDLSGISVRIRSDRPKTPSGELAEPRFSSCACISWIKFVASTAGVMQHDLRAH